MMASDLARLFALAHNYHLDPSLYHSRAEAYDIKSDLFKEFVSLLMNPNSSKQQILVIADKLNIDSDEVLSAGLKFMQEIIFSADRNHYEVLGLRQDASTEAIKKRYRYMIAMFHPDKCATHHLDGELYAALLNNAYNTLKNETSRQTYNEALFNSVGVNQKGGQSRYQQHARSGTKASVKRRPTLFASIPDQFPFFRHYPKSTVWGFMGVSFVAMIYLSSLDTMTITPSAKVAVKPAIQIREIKRVDESKLTRSQMLEKDESGKAYLEKTIQSEQLSGMLGIQAEGGAAQSGISSKVKDANESMGKDMLPDDVGLALQQPESRNIDNAADANTSVTTMDLVSGFDGGLPGTSADVSSLLDDADSIGQPLRIETFLIPPELIMMEFVQSYETGDIEKFSRLFSDDVKTNHGRGRQQLVSRFSSLFDATTSRKIKIKQLRVEPQNKAEALLISDIEAVVKHASESEIRHFNGAIVLRLITGDSSMQIAEMAHSVH